MLQPKFLKRFLFVILVFASLPIIIPVVSEKVSAHMKCPVKTPWGSKEELCPHYHLKKPAESDIPSNVDPPGSYIKFCNKIPNKTIFASYASFQYSDGWVSKGWYKVEPQKCREILIGNGYEGDIFTYGQASSMSEFWGRGDGYFCVNKVEPFRIKNSDKNCSGDEFKKVGMSKFKVGTGINTWSFIP